MRQPIIAGNWKMNLGRLDEALDFVRHIRHPLSEIEGVERVLCPPFTVLTSVAEILLPTRIKLGAQNMHWEEQGAYTGEISPMMLANICQFVILGHSERRTGKAAFPDKSTQYSIEPDDAINLKVLAALSHDLTPIICLGENLEQNEAGKTHELVGDQVQKAMVNLTAEQAEKCVIAYEPIWAIGTGKAATPVDANRVIGLTIRGNIAEMFGESTAQIVRVLYGGSVNVENIVDFMSMPGVDGALVGGASLKPDFVELVRRAASV